MNLVDERDLLSLMDEEEAAEFALPRSRRNRNPPESRSLWRMWRKPEEPEKKSTPRPC